MKNITSIKGILEYADSRDLEEDYIAALGEAVYDDTDCRSDGEILRDEVEHLLDLYSESGTAFNTELKRARKILKETDNGSRIPMNLEIFATKSNKLNEMFKQTKEDVALAQGRIEEYNRLKKLPKLISEYLKKGVVNV